MADTKKDTKKVKTDEKAAETIVDEVTAESTDTAETTTTDVNVTETVDVPEEQAEAAKPKPVAKENRRGSKALREENDKLKERCQDAEDKYKRLLAECENIRQRNEKESSKMYDFGAKDVLGKLLPVVDNFERAIAAIPEEDKDRPFEAGVDNNIGTDEMIPMGTASLEEIAKGIPAPTPEEVETAKKNNSSVCIGVAGAVAKLQEQLKKAKDKSFADPIIKHLIERCRESESLASDVCQDHKTWEKCYKYIYEQARKQAKGSSCAVLDDVVYEWAEDYFHKDDKAEEDKKAKEAAEREKKQKADQQKRLDEIGRAHV